MDLILIFCAVAAASAEAWAKSISAENNEGDGAVLVDEERYGAITFQYTPVGWDQDEQLTLDIIEKNLEKLEETLGDTKGKDILVFPEYALTTIKVKDDRELALNLSQAVPPLGKNYCHDESSKTISSDDLLATSRLSCLAKRLNITLVANLVEKVACKEREINQTQSCSPDGFLLFNTNVAFDNDGKLVAKYRKFNLLEEPAFNRTEAAEVAKFTTAFGVTFGLVTGHDLLFHSPAFQLINEQNVTNFLHPTAWVNTLPFTTGTQVQMGWSHTAGVNLVSSCYLEVEKGYSGAGVYRKDGSFRTAVGLETGATIVGKNADLANFFTQADPLMAEFSSVLLANSSSGSEVQTCHGEFCCQLQFATTADLSGDFFQLVAFNGTDAAGFEVQACGLVACSAPDVTSCADSINEADYAADVTFDYLRLNGDFRSSMVMPSTLKADTALPFSLKSLLGKEQRDNSWEVSVEMNESVKVHTFALYSHDYRVGGGANNAGNAAAAAISCLLLQLVLMIIV